MPRTCGTCSPPASWGHCCYIRAPHTPPVVLQVEVAARHVKDGVGDLEADLGAVMGQHEVGHLDHSLGAADVGPLLDLRQERTIQAGRHSLGKEQLGRELGGDRGRAVRPPVAGQQVAADPRGQLPVEQAQDEADAVPAQVSQATQRLQAAVGADVPLEELRRSAEENWQTIRRICPMLWPSLKTSRRRSIRWLCMNITPSMNWTPLRRQAARISCTSPAVAATGFSESTCFPASAARISQALRTPVGSGTYTASTVSLANNSS